MAANQHPVRELESVEPNEVAVPSVPERGVVSAKDGGPPIGVAAASSQHSSAAEMLKLLHKKWPEAVVIVNAEIRRLEEQLEATRSLCDELAQSSSEEGAENTRLREEILAQQAALEEAQQVIVLALSGVAWGAFDSDGSGRTFEDRARAAMASNPATSVGPSPASPPVEAVSTAGGPAVPDPALRPSDG